MIEIPAGTVVIDDYPVRRWLVKGTTDLPNYGVLLKYLVDNYKVCYWCGVEVTLHKTIDGLPIPTDRATIDHLKPRPFRTRHETVKKVLACRECNQRRGIESHREAKNG